MPTNINTFKLNSKSNYIKILLLLIFLMTAFQSNSLTFLKAPTYEDLIDSSELIVEGLVISSSVNKRKITSHQWSPNGTIKYHPTIVITEYLIQVNEVFKGKIHTNILKLWAPFGCYENRCSVQDNSYNIEEDDKLIFFLNVDDENYSDKSPIYWANGHSLGLFSYKDIGGEQFIENYYFKTENHNVIESEKVVLSKNKKIATKEKTESFQLITTIENLLEMINEE